MDYSILGSILGSPYFGKLPFAHFRTTVAHFVCFSADSIKAARSSSAGRQCRHVAGQDWQGCRLSQLRINGDL